jgi:hypothetical protein
MPVSAVNKYRKFDYLNKKREPVALYKKHVRKNKKRGPNPFEPEKIFNWVEFISDETNNEFKYYVSEKNFRNKKRTALYKLSVFFVAKQRIRNQYIKNQVRKTDISV